MSTSTLFKKHFGDTCAISMKHPNIESFFEELNQECLDEDKEKIKSQKAWASLSASPPPPARIN